MNKLENNGIRKTATHFLLSYSVDFDMVAIIQFDTSL